MNLPTLAHSIIRAESIETKIRRERAKGKGTLKIAKELGVGASVVQRVLKSA
jgi:hypothetical protein